MSTDPRARPDSALDSRLAALANALGRSLKDLRDRLDSVEKRLAGLPERTSQTTADLRAVLAHLEFIRTKLAEPLGDAGRKVDMLGEQVSMLPEEMSSRIDGSTAELRHSLEALPGLLAEVLEPLRGLPARIDELAPLRDIGPRIEALEPLRQLPAKLEALRPLEELPAKLEALRPLEELPGKVEEAIGSIGEIRNRVAALEGGMEQARQENAQAIEAIPDVVAEKMEGVATRLASIISERMADIAGRLEEAISQVKEGAKDRAYFEEQLAKIAEQVVDPEDLAQRARMATEAALSGFTEDYTRRSETLEEALRKVDGMSEALGSLEKRRGARELLEGEARLLEQQEAISRRVTDTASELDRKVEAIDGNISAILERVDRTKLGAEVADRIEVAVAELKESMANDLGKRLSHAIAAISKAAAEKVAQDVGTRVENLKEELAEEAMKAGTQMFMRGTAGLNEEIGAMRAKIDSWGKSRTAPKVAEQIAGMEKRIDKLGKAVEEDLVDAVFDRMQRAFDRRFEVLVQLVETRMREILERQQQQESPAAHRRRFLRKEED